MQENMHLFDTAIFAWIFQGNYHPKPAANRIKTLIRPEWHLLMVICRITPRQSNLQEKGSTRDSQVGLG
jgi:hypothetical protein